MDRDEIFTIEARRCKRCGGLLTNHKAISDGYGHVCKMKSTAETEKKNPIDGQISLDEEA